jgi:hypothetical protein
VGRDIWRPWARGVDGRAGVGVGVGFERSYEYEGCFVVMECGEIITEGLGVCRGR